jgi:DNA-binding CsgD family transcriptional regulator
LEILDREAEVARIGADLESLRSMPVKLLLEGEAGIGKTTLWLAAVDAAAASRYVVLTSRPAEAEAGLPYAGLADLLAPLDEDAFRTLPDPQRRALETALLRREADGRPPDARAVGTGFLRLLERLAESAPVVVAVDDLQWLDAATARACEFAIRRFGAANIGVIAAARVVDGAVATTRGGWFSPHERLRVAPLRPTALHQLIHERLGVALSRPAALRLHGACAGNAFHALEIARHLAATRIDDEEWLLPDGVQELVRLHLDALPASARWELLLAAAAAQPTEDLLRPETLLAAEQAGLIRISSGRLRFMHPLYAEAIYGTASTAVRRNAHAALAAQAPDVVERARHLGLASERPDADVARELEAAASAARARGAPETAAQLTQQAYELTPAADQEAAARRATTAAADWFNAGAFAEARMLLATVLSSSSQRAFRAHALRLLALIHFREESVPEAMELLRRAAAAAGADDELRARAELQLAYCSVSVSFDFDAARPHADAALERAERVGDPGLLAQALAVKAIADFLLGDPIDEQRLARALELERRDEIDCPAELRPTLIAGCLDLYVGALDRARERFYALSAWLRERGRDVDLPLVLCEITWVEAWVGNLAAADAASAEAVRLARLSGGDAQAGLTLAYAALSAAYLGHESDCRSHAAQALAGMERAGYLIHATWSLSALGLLELSRGEAAAAVAAYVPLLEFAERGMPAEPARAFFVPDAIEALVAVDEVERAARLLESFMARAEACDRSWALAAGERCRALIAMSRRDHDAASTCIERALALHARTPMPLERARSLLVQGQIERRRKRRRAARDAFSEAASIFESAGARLWAERVRTELERTSGSPAGPGLSPTERRVAELAAAGRTNREIAASLFISPKTVEANLARIYDKLGIHTRAELGARIASERAGAASSG